MQTQDLALLVSVPHEVEAASIANALDAHGIQAVTAGGYTSGFKAEAPGEVKVLVKHSDLARARDVLSQIRSEASSIDWSSVDVGRPE